MITRYTLEHDLPVFAGQGMGDEAPTAGWLNLIDPSPEECLLAHETLGIPLEHLKAVLDYNERPRLEYANEILLIIARAPVVDDTNLSRPFSTCPVALVLKENLLVTVCLKASITEELASRKIPGEGSHKAIRLMLSLLMRISTSFIKYLQLLDERVGDIEKTLQESMQNQELLKMLHMEKSLIYFLTALKGNQAVMEKLRTGSSQVATSEERELLDDVLIENKQATDMAEIYTQIIGSLGDAFGAIVSNNLNKVMKVLTGLTIVFMIPTIIGALYGMNVPLPWQDNPYSFAVLTALCLGVSFAVYRLLKKMDWM